MQVVKSSRFAICFPPRTVHSNYLPMALCHCWIRGTGENRLLEDYRFCIGRIFRGWCTRNIAYKSIIVWQVVDDHSGPPSVSNSSSLGCGRFYRSVWQWPYPINTQWMLLANHHFKATNIDHSV
jgi:hypothetical protein